jgi:hypothetical protein
MRKTGAVAVTLWPLQHLKTVTLAMATDKSL